eukprot:PhF_6_TR25105/c0_g1_i1/m.34500
MSYADPQQLCAYIRRLKEKFSQPHLQEEDDGGYHSNPKQSIRKQSPTSQQEAPVEAILPRGDHDERNPQEEVILAEQQQQQKPSSSSTSPVDRTPSPHRVDQTTTRTPFLSEIAPASTKKRVTTTAKKPPKQEDSSLVLLEDEEEDGFPFQHGDHVSYAQYRRQSQRPYRGVANNFPELSCLTATHLQQLFDLAESAYQHTNKSDPEVCMSADELMRDIATSVHTLRDQQRARQQHLKEVVEKQKSTKPKATAPVMILRKNPEGTAKSRAMKSAHERVRTVATSPHRQSRKMATPITSTTTKRGGGGGAGSRSHSAQSIRPL